jgi:hypothetical protein
VELVSEIVVIAAGGCILYQRSRIRERNLQVVDGPAVIGHAPWQAEKAIRFDVRPRPEGWPINEGDSCKVERECRRKEHVEATQVLSELDRQPPAAVKLMPSIQPAKYRSIQPGAAPSLKPLRGCDDRFLLRHSSASRVPTATVLLNRPVDTLS